MAAASYEDIGLVPLWLRTGYHLLLQQLPRAMAWMVLLGVVGEVDACLETFDPFGLVGSVVDECPQVEDRGLICVTWAAAVVASETWKGPVAVGNGYRHLWYGLSPGVDLTGNDPSY